LRHKLPNLSAADLSVQAPTKYELVIKMFDAVGWSMPHIQSGACFAGLLRTAPAPNATGPAVMF
jgi:hypothetical protein